MKLGEEKRIRWAAAAVVCALVLRLFAGGGWGLFVDAITTPEAVAWLFYLETGRRITTLYSPQDSAGDGDWGEQTVTTPPKEPDRAVFAPEDAAAVEVQSYCGYSVDTKALLTQSLNWDLTEDGPAVLILHSHGTESYTKTEDYTESSGYRTLNTDYNVVSIGERIARVLEAGGVQVLHDKAMHDYPSYNLSYTQARKSIEEYLAKYPTIRMVLDIHRDAVESGGNQISYTVDVQGKKAAQVMMVVGTDAGGLIHPKWPENMALAVKLHAQLEKNVPGICRPISFRKQRFNQDLSTGALIVEVGAAGNTRQEALLAGQLVAESILDLAYGATGTELS